MINRVMKTGVTAVALAASALLATPANAQERSFNDRGVSAADLRGGDLTLRRDRGDRVQFRERRGGRDNFRGNRGRGHNDGFRRGRNHKVHLNEYGQTPREVQYLVKDAIYTCSCQLEIDAHKYGYKDAGFRRTPYVEQVGRNKFVVKGRAKLFDGYDYSRQSYDCLVRKGKIKRATDIYPVRYNNNHNRRNGFGGVSFSFGSNW